MKYRVRVHFRGRWDAAVARGECPWWCLFDLYPWVIESERVA
jgi:hypothetical protein